MKDKSAELVREQAKKKSRVLDSKERALQLIKNKAIITVKDAVRANISRNLLSDLAKKGLIIQIKPGVYEAVERNLSAYESFIELSVLAPNAVISLLSALQFHELTTENPHQVWVAFLRGQRIPKIDYPPTRHVIFSEKSYYYEIEEHTAEGVHFRVYSVAKTIADCFKYRNKIGLDVAIQALKDGLDSKKATVNEIWKAAKICRVHNIIRPYMETL
jgi:predicted transcriptional regulator of viral defense system